MLLTRIDDSKKVTDKVSDDCYKTYMYAATYAYAGKASWRASIISLYICLESLKRYLEGLTSRNSVKVIYLSSSPGQVSRITSQVSFYAFKTNHGYSNDTTNFDDVFSEMKMKVDAERRLSNVENVFQDIFESDEVTI